MIARLVCGPSALTTFDVSAKERHLDSCVRKYDTCSSASAKLRECRSGRVRAATQRASSRKGILLPQPCARGVRQPRSDAKRVCLLSARHILATEMVMMRLPVSNHVSPYRLRRAWQRSAGEFLQRYGVLFMTIAMVTYDDRHAGWARRES